MKNNLRPIYDVPGGAYKVKCISAEEHDHYEFVFEILEDEHWSGRRLTMSVPRNLHWRGELMDVAHAFGLAGENGSEQFDLESFVGRVAYAEVEGTRKSTISVAHTREDGSREITTYHGSGHIVSSIGRTEDWCKMQKAHCEKIGTVEVVAESPAGEIIWYGQREIKLEEAE